MKHKRHRAVVEELVFHVKALAREALQGSEPARAWLVTSFPSNVDHLLTVWSAVDEGNQTTNAPHSSPASGAPSRGR